MSRPIRVRLFETLVLRPLRAAQNRWGEPIWTPVERGSRAMGALAARLCRPFMVRKGDQSVEPLLRFTQFWEERIGIQGTNEVTGPTTGVRRIHHCPYAQFLRAMPQFCMAVGKVAGDGAFARLIPGSDYEIVQRQACGAATCEYVYWIGRKPGS